METRSSLDSGMSPNRCRGVACTREWGDLLSKKTRTYDSSHESRWAELTASAIGDSRFVEVARGRHRAAKGACSFRSNLFGVRGNHRSRAGSAVRNIEKR